MNTLIEKDSCAKSLCDVELAIVVPVKGQPGRRVGTLTMRVQEGTTLPEIIKSVRHDYGQETEGVVFLDSDSYNQTVHDWHIRHQKPEVTQKPAEEREAVSAI